MRIKKKDFKNIIKESLTMLDPNEVEKNINNLVDTVEKSVGVDTDKAKDIVASMSSGDETVKEDSESNVNRAIDSGISTVDNYDEEGVLKNNATIKYGEKKTKGPDKSDLPFESVVKESKSRKVVKVIKVKNLRK